MSERSAPDLRALLRSAEPSDFPVKKAWREVIRALRSHKKRTGHLPALSSLAAVDRALGTVPLDPEVASRLKPLLRGVLREELGEPAALEIDRLVAEALPRIQEGLVGVDIVGWPEDLTREQQARLLRRDAAPPYELPAPEAAAVVREFEGFLIAGHSLHVVVELDADCRLPPVPRALRARPQPRGRSGPWLPYWDDEGRRFLTPEALATRLARRLSQAGVTELIDGCAGLGGNAIAFAREGIDVLAVEQDAARLGLARRNASALGVGDRISWSRGRIEEQLETLPIRALFLDPPWDRTGGVLPAWLPLPTDRLVVLKTPGSFDPQTLPRESWSVDYEFGEAEDDFWVLKMLTIQIP